jgi:hypothetical protein
VRYWEIIADNLKKGGWSLGWVSAVDSEGRTIWIVDANGGDGKRFVVRADEKLTAFLELEAAIAATANVEETTWQTPEPWASEGLAKANLFHYLFRASAASCGSF